MSIRICDRCGHPHLSSDVIRQARFDQGRAAGYLARPIARTFPSRDAAERAICEFWASKRGEKQ